MSQPPPLSWNDAHFCGLRSQTNIYGLSKVVLKNNQIKLLAASIDGHLASFKFEYHSDSSSPSEKQVPISNNDVLFDSVLNADNPDIEGEFEIVSTDVVCDWDHQGGNILAVAYLKLGHYDEDKAPEAFMNIYQLSKTDDKILDVSKSLIQHLSLDFIPFKLAHHRTLLKDGNWENLLLLSGTDNKIHVYQPMDSYSGYEDVDTAKYFPEFSNIDDCVTHFAIKQLDDMYRVASYGTQNGLVCLYLLNVLSQEILESWSSESDSPITSLHFFHQHTNVQLPDFLKNGQCSNQEKDDEDFEEEPLNLLVTSAVDPSVVFYDVITNGLNRVRVLPVSNSQDVVLCSCVMDVDFDGENEVLIGTYGKVLLVYKLTYEKPQMYSSTPFHSPFPVPIRTDTPILPDEGDKPGKQQGTDSQDKDIRRRHKSLATTSSENVTSVHTDKHDLLKVDNNGGQPDVLQQALLRLVRSQENLASPSTKSIHFETPNQLQTPDINIPHFAMAPVLDYPCYRLLWTRRFCNPVMDLSCEDVMADGMLDLLVLTLKGLHILQPDLEEISTIVLNRLQRICDLDNVFDQPPKETYTERGETCAT